MYKFTVEGEPTGKGRPRVTRTHTYTPKKTKDYEAKVVQAYTGQYFEGEIKIEIDAYYGIPKSKPKYMQEMMRNGEIKPTKKPDWDNVGKIICDSLNGIAYKDDSQIITATVNKMYSDNARVEVTIYE